MKLSQTKKHRLFFPEKNENQLDFRLNEGYCIARTLDQYSADSAPELISSVISAKLCVNLPSSICSFAPEKKCQHRKIVSSCLAGRFSVVSGAGFLAGPSHNAYGKRPAFLCPDATSYAGKLLFPRGRHVSVRLSPQSSNLSSRRFVHPAAFGIFSRHVSKGGVVEHE